MILYSVIALKGPFSGGAHPDSCKFATTLYTNKFPRATYVRDRPFANRSKSATGLIRSKQLVPIRAGADTEAAIIFVGTLYDVIRPYTA